ncbi:MAG TPA: hypothetical protein PK867_19405, partial [Pirellulales bacterium]|nr:hypothetical protein [Pirellulales bacterium]
MLALLLASAATADENDRLSGTQPLTWQGDLSARMLDGAHRLIDRKIEESIQLRLRYWRRGLSSTEAYAESVAPNRQRFARQIGAVDSRLPPAMERFGDDDCPALVAKTAGYRIFQVRWPVLDGVWGEGLLLEPAKPSTACVVVLGDADQTPEQLAGLERGVEPDMQTARILAESGCLVVVPTLVNRDDRFTGNPISGRPNPGYSHREWIYRQAYHIGRHIIGYEVQKVLAVIDWFEKRLAQQSPRPP